MKRFQWCIIAVFLVFAQSLFAQTALSSNGLTVSVNYYDKTIYYPSEADDNPVQIRVTLSNTGTDTVRFKMADDHAFSMDFVAITAKNAALNYNSALIQKRSTSQTVYFREIALEPGEEYSFVENLKDYITIPSSAVYYFQVRFYPELLKSKLNYVDSNRLSLDVRPMPNAIIAQAQQKTTQASVLKPEAISPDKVIERTIIARQKSLWDEFFLYMDLEQMLQSDEVRDRKYRAGSAAERATQLLEFKELFKTNDLIASPDEFEIKKTEYSQTDGTVTVIERFYEETYVQIREYIYYLRLRDGIWQLYKYDVNNVGTE